MGLLKVLLIFAGISAANAADLTTLAEQTGFRKTGRYDETIRLCQGLEKAFPKKAKCIRFGTTPEGRPMVMLALSADGTLSPEQCRKKSRPVVFFQAGIHAGEIDGKDAGFWTFREMLDGKIPSDALKAVTVLFLPVFNIDGHERFGAYNRPNQIGPDEMGWRTTGQNLNLNRDYLKVDAPEMRSLLKALDPWDPMLLVDLHVTDGMDFEEEVGFIFEPIQVGPKALQASARLLETSLMIKMRKLGHLPMNFYPDPKTPGDFSTGFERDVTGAKYSQGYWRLRNRIGLLVETHSWKDYKTRVSLMRDTMISLLEDAAKNGADWIKAARMADVETQALAGTDWALLYDFTDKSEKIDFRGYEIRKEASSVSGTTRLIYEPLKKVTTPVQVHYEVKPALTARVPKQGYVVPAALVARLKPKFDAHGIKTLPIAQSKALKAWVFRATDASFDPGPREGRQRVKLKGEWKEEEATIPPGSLLIPISQSRAPLAIEMLEPQSPESLAAWGEFNVFFEPREYMEAYVTEAVAAEMLAKNPEIKTEFEAKLRSDPEFAKSPAKRLEHFYRKHPSWDSSYFRYPIIKVDLLNAR